MKFWREFSLAVGLANFLFFGDACRGGTKVSRRLFAVDLRLRKYKYAIETHAVEIFHQNISHLKAERFVAQWDFIINKLRQLNKIRHCYLLFPHISNVCE